MEVLKSSDKIIKINREQLRKVKCNKEGGISVSLSEPLFTVAFEEGIINLEEYYKLVPLKQRPKKYRILFIRPFKSTK